MIILFFSFGTQQPIALLKLLLDKGGMFDRDKDLNWKKIKDVLYFGAMSSPQGSRYSIDPRCISLFSVFNIPMAKEAAIISIYQSILRGHLLNFTTELLPISDQLITITVNLFKVRVKKK